MKKLFLVLLVSMSTVMAEAQISASKWVKNVGIGWCLGNSFEAFNDVDSTYAFHSEAELKANLGSETQWNNPRTTKAMIDSVRAAGFNAVRIPVRWYPHFIYNNGGLTIDKAWTDRLREVIDWCLADGMQVIINAHHEKWFDEHTSVAEASLLRPKFMALWTEIAKAFADYDGRLAFAGTSELHESQMDFTQAASAEHALVQNFYNQAFVDAVRATGGNNQKRNLIVQTYAAEPYYNPSTFKLPEDKVRGHLIAEVHMYAPAVYCMTGMRKYYGPQYSQLNELKDIPAEYSRHLWSDDAPYLIAQQLFQIQNKGIPVILGEFGAGRWNEVGAPVSDKMLQSRMYYYQNVVGICKKEGIACFAWDNGVIDDPSIPYHIYFFDRKAGMKNLDPHTISAMMSVLR